MAYPIRPLTADESRRLDRLEAKLDSTISKTTDAISDLREDVSSLRTSVEMGAKAAHERFDRLDKSISDLSKSLGGRVEKVEAEQSKARLRWAKLSGALLIVSVVLGTYGGKILAILGALI